MNFLNPLLPEIAILCVACLALFSDLFSKDREKKTCYLITQLGIISVFILLLGSIHQPKQILYHGTFVFDTLATLLKLGILLLTFVALVYARVFIRDRRFLRGEYYTLTLFAALGMMVMVSAHSLLTVYLGIELLSLTLYAMIAMQRDDKRAPEAAVKYFVTGAIASGFLLYGMSLLYGVTGHLKLSAISQVLLEPTEFVWLARFAIVFMLAGVVFKLGLVPFHMWIPDVYHGAPTSVTAFIASAPKVAAFGLTIRLLLEGVNAQVSDWSQILLVAGMLSIGLGNLVALAQTNFKRLLAYSGIAHMGYFALGFFAGDYGGYAASMFYVFVYAMMTLAGFGLLVFMSRLGYECEDLDDFKGLGQQNAWYGLMFTLVMLSMAGIPPLLGFWPKLEIFRALVASGYSQVAVYAVIFSVVGLYYYLRVVKVIFFDKATKDFMFMPSRSIRFALTFNCLGFVVLGISPDVIYRYCLMAFS
ncbi:NADH-quinone oxidoreductase subunit NuoN [Pleionea sp. CnH1-48]|uniref:NADH-quinone oxidoreductase subunit NuoN n=1 Tax=Pleionea sp. CnH1-48 TaxID=2954494 RepID=UPI002096D6C0|nr:NADH-quinone oxidoreductase subunit NuoN [Pleionea sp. CnH1-48]MCO7225045.1 NADH-quinone oxidoreductase subunit NuoN [Pleionea sp. CnH1-48]